MIWIQSIHVVPLAFLMGVATAGSGQQVKERTRATLVQLPRTEVTLTS
jgi:hypothetical protein